MGTKIKLLEEFDKWFNEVERYALRSERFHDDIKRNNGEIAVKWLKAAFIQGSRVMAQDTLNTLGDYSADVAGISDICYNRSEAFDSSHKNLMTYYTQILQDVENE